MRRGGGRIIGLAGMLAALVAGAPAALADEPAEVLFVAGKRGNTLSKVDLATGEEVLRLPSCTNPHELATSPDGQHVALACYGGTSVDVFRTDTLERVKSIDLGDNARPHGIVWHDNGNIFVTAEGRQSVFHILGPLTGATVLFEFSTGKQGSHMLAVSPDARTAWTTDLGSRTVTRVDLVTRRAPISVAVGEEPEGIALSPDGKTLWVSARGSNQAFALDPQRRHFWHCFAPRARIEVVIDEPSLRWSGSAIAGIPMTRALKTIWPFWLSCLAVLMLVTFIPALSLWLPSLMK